MLRWFIYFPFFYFDEFVWTIKLPLFSKGVNAAHDGPISIFFFNDFKSVDGLRRVFWMFILPSFFLCFLIFTFLLMDSFSFPFVEHIHQILEFLPHQGDNFILPWNFVSEFMNFFLIDIFLSCNEVFSKGSNSSYSFCGLLFQFGYLVWNVMG